MIHIFINALSATAGGGLTYVRNVIPVMASRQGVRITLLVPHFLRSEITESERVSILSLAYPTQSAMRFWFEQKNLAEAIRDSGADVLLSTGNFAIFRSPVPQILLSRNALYISDDFYRDLHQRRDYRLWLDTKLKGALARRSVMAADCTVAPSEVFAAELRRWTGRPVQAIHHGFNPQAFFRHDADLSKEVKAKLHHAACSLRILFVSHYNYYRNFETLIRAAAVLKESLHPRTVRILLTCKLTSDENPGSYKANSAAVLVKRLDLANEIIELGSVPYAALHHVYKQCDVYATPAYAETFAHPLIESMASGLPIVTSDIPVHREICGDAALYFPRFSHDELAHRIVEVSNAVELKTRMRIAGLDRAQHFSWSQHVDQLLQLAESLIVKRPVDAGA